MVKIVIWKSGQWEFKMKVDYVFVVIGRKFCFDGLQLEQVGVDFFLKGILVNGYMQMNVFYIYVCGDVIGGIQLVYVVFYEGIIVVFYVFGRDVKINEKYVFCCIYIFLEIVCIGLIE